MKNVVLKIDSLIQTSSILWLMTIIGTILHGLLCFGQTIWLDEALTGSYIRMGWTELLAFTTTDVHPPLYYLIVKLGITLLGDHIYIVKLFSFLPFVFMLLLTVTKAKKEYGSKTAFILLIFLNTTPCIIERNAEMRMYQWAMFFVFAFALYLFDAIKNCERRKWLICLVFGLCAAYTHYYALLAVAILYALVFFVYIKKHSIVIHILLNAVVSIVGYLPWMLVFLAQAKTLKETGWWQESILGFGDVYEYLVWPFKDKTGYEAVLFLILLLGVWGYLLLKRQSENRIFAMCSIGTYLLLIISGIMIILFYQPVFITRFIYPTVGLLLLGLAIVISGWRVEIICVISVFLLFFATKTYNSQLHYQFNQDSVPALNAFMETVEKDTLIICDQDAVKCIMEYLFPDYEVENDVDVEVEDITDRDIYYFVCDENSLVGNRLESLGISEYKYMEEISLLYHGFEIHKVLKER